MRKGPVLFEVKLERALNEGVPPISDIKHLVVKTCFDLSRMITS